MKWFGENWGAPICGTTEHVPAPEGLHCARECGHTIRYGDQGLLLPFLGDKMSNETEIITIDGQSHVAYHLVCFFDTIGIRGVTHN